MKTEESVLDPEQVNLESTAATANPLQREPAPLFRLAPLVGSLALTACGGGGGGSPSPATTGSPPPPVDSYAIDAADAAAARFLLHAQVGATDADIAAVKAQGAAAYLESQFAAPTSQRAWDWLVTQGYSVIDEHTEVTLNEPIDFVLLAQLVLAPDAVRKRVALALSEHFVVSVLPLAGMGWLLFSIAHYWDQLNEHAFGSFRALLEAVTLNPAMGQFLNTRGNLKEDPVTGRVPDENYAREVMQLFTIGLVQLNADGTPKLDALGNPIPTFGSDDVTNLARVFTGYDYWDDGQRFTDSKGRTNRYPEYWRRPMALDASLHSTLPVQFLGTSIASSLTPAERLRIALDALFAHPNVGPFFGRQMIQRLVTSNPSPGYVARVTAAFNDNGRGVRGDLQALWRAILLDEEAQGQASLQSSTFGKIREPMVRVFQWMRSFKVNSAKGTWKLNYEKANWYNQRPFYAPSVFNFFRPGYVPPGTAMSAVHATAPEFQIINETTVCQWANWCEDMVTNGFYVVQPELPFRHLDNDPPGVLDIAADYRDEIPLAADPAALLRRLNLLLCAGQMSEATQRKIVSILRDPFAITSASSDSAKRDRVVSAITLMMFSSEYIVQK